MRLLHRSNAVFIITKLKSVTNELQTISVPAQNRKEMGLPLKTLGLDVVAHARNSSIWEAEAEGSLLTWKPTWPT